MTGPLSFGILGCARIARRGMIAGIQEAPSARLAAIASRNPRTAAAWAQEFAIPRHYASYDELLSDPDIDAVYNPLPNELHSEWTLRAAAAGKHILCEKPLGLDYADASQIVEGCRRAGVIVMEAFMWRHQSRVAHARSMLARGELGELRLVTIAFSFDIDHQDWRLDSARGGGSLTDLGCYAINAARLFAGSEPLEVHAHARLLETGVDMSAGMLLRFPGDVLALADSSFECPYRNRLEVVGTKASLVFPEGVLPPPEAELIVTDSGGTRAIRFPRCNPYAEQVEAFCTGVAAGRLPEPAEDGLANMRVLDAAIRSSRRDRTNVGAG
jgi:xylose dehydrogenase (NAD/NADP)